MKRLKEGEGTPLLPALGSTYIGLYQGKFPFF